MSPRDASETVDRIAAAALQLLREKGSAGLTMRKVAVSCGLSLSNVQYHFPSRERLLVGVTERHLQLCREAMQRAMERAGDASEVTLRHVLDASLLDEDVLQTALPFRELFALAVQEPTVHDRLAAHYQASLQALTDFLGERSTLPRSELEEIASVVVTAIEGAYLLADALPIRAERLVARLEATVERMLGLAP